MKTLRVKEERQKEEQRVIRENMKKRRNTRLFIKVRMNKEKIHFILICPHN
jgi:hypothetical protein